MGSIQERSGEQLPPKELLVVNSIRPVIENEGKILLFCESTEWSSKYNPPRWMLPQIRIDGPEDFTGNSLAIIIQTHLGFKVRVNGKIKTSEVKDPTPLIPNVTFRLVRTWSFKCKMEAGEVRLDPKVHSSFDWFLKEELANLPLDDISRETFERI